ncbi:hypothetical protein BCR43DRAFT_195052 [Syncephalastrum racemosum]|uniref:Uncharacterized protein n=1 Tax=Syncephalastrum racemosum TaxID=13706 RepID=A0A1X2HHD8_SYNRA|nr:hypothetical protein BCR43DRAFT_195052 [Syncephalastrum racemosum]
MCALCSPIHPYYSASYQPEYVPPIGFFYYFLLPSRCTDRTVENLYCCRSMYLLHYQCAYWAVASQLLIFFGFKIRQPCRRRITSGSFCG